MKASKARLCMKFESNAMIRGRRCFLWKLPLWLRVVIAGWLSFTAVFGFYLTNSASLQHPDTVSYRGHVKLKFPITSAFQQSEKHQPATATRRNLIIIAHGRSGSSLTFSIIIPMCFTCTSHCRPWKELVNTSN